MKVVDNFSKYIKDNESSILTGFGIGLSILSTCLAIAATKKAEKELEELDKPTTKEKIFVCGRNYLPAILTESAAIYCITRGKSLDAKQISKLSLVYETQKTLFKKYGEEVKKQFGKNKEEDIRREAAKKATPKASLLKGSENLSLYDGDNYFKDPLTGKLFISSSVKIESAMNIFNDRLNNFDEAPLYDFYEEIYESTPIPLNKNLLDGEIFSTVGFIRNNGLVEVKYEDPEKITINGNGVSYIPIRFVDKQKGTYRDPLEYYEEGRR